MKQLTTGQWSAMVKASEASIKGLFDTADKERRALTAAERQQIADCESVIEQSHQSRGRRTAPDSIGGPLLGRDVGDHQRPAPRGRTMGQLFGQHGGIGASDFTGVADL